MLLPPDLRDWVMEDDRVHFVITAVEGMQLSTLKVNERGTGSEPFPPRMMLALLIDCYATGIFSSRRIERDLADGQSLPEEIARRERLLEKMQQAREQLEQRAKRLWALQMA